MSAGGFRAPHPVTTVRERLLAVACEAALSGVDVEREHEAPEGRS